MPRPTQQAFEGDTLEAALARVKDEVGPDARITQAEKVRTGGIAGFFSRERFEVTVEIDDVAAARPTPATDPVPAAAPADASAAPKSLLDLVDEVSARERGVYSPAADQRAVDEPVPSTAGKSFHAVLQGIAAEAGLIPPVAGSARVAPGEADSTPAPVRARVPREWDLPEERAVPEERAAEETDRPEDIGPPEGTGPLEGAGSANEPVPAEDPPTETDERFPVTSEMLAALGIPRGLLGPGAGRTSPAQRVLTAMEQLPPSAPLVARRGDVVVVVGDEQVAMEAATVAAAQFGQTIEDVVVAGMDKAGFNTLSSIDDARARIALWRRCGVPFVVAVCIPSNAEATDWARQMVEALEPVAVWAAVRADRKPDDVAAWTARLGRADALAVGATAETVSPAAVLGAGIPVAVLDGRRSTAAAWTALLVERLTA